MPKMPKLIGDARTRMNQTATEKVDLLNPLLDTVLQGATQARLERTGA